MERILCNVLLGILYFGLSQASETCTNWDYGMGYHYCEHGCCDSWPYETCCSEDAWLGWAIAGGIIGGLLLISMVVCIVCTFVKQKGRSGRVIQPNQGQSQPPGYAPNVTYVSYPQNQVILPAYTHPSAPPPPYQAMYDPPIYAQNQAQPQRLPPMQPDSQNNIQQPPPSVFPN